MANITENREIIVRGGNPRQLMEGQAAASTRFYAGSFCYYDATNGGITDASAAGANPFAGIIKKEVDNSSGALGDLDVEFYTDGIFTVPQDGTIAATEVGALCESAENHTVIDPAGAGATIGRVVRRISATWVEVDISQRA